MRILIGALISVLLSANGTLNSDLKVPFVPKSGQYILSEILLADLPPRQTCDKYYRGHEDALAQAHNCHEIGASACGGPDQCACGKNERLVSFKCDEGTFNGCSPSKDGHPRCP